MAKSITVAIAVSLLAATASAQPVQWPASVGGNDHWYEAVVAPEGLSWSAAQAAAQARGGYLVTMTSSAENSFVFGLIDAPEFWFPNNPPFQFQLKGPWIGLRQPFGSPEPDGGWEWVNGEGPVGYVNWFMNEPNNGGGNEDRAAFFNTTTQARTPRWNDVPEGASIRTYVIEWEFQPIPALATPVWWPLAALAVAAAGLWSLRRRRTG